MKRNLLKKIKTTMGVMKENKAIRTAQILGATALLLSVATPAFAAVDTSSIDVLVDFFCDWLTKIGLVVALFGGCQVGFAFKNDDSDAKTRGLHTMASGLIVAGICASKSIFGL